MKRKKYKTGLGVVVFFLIFGLQCHAQDVGFTEGEGQHTPGTLYAQSAVLMDGSLGRVLYEKNGEEFLANASTTKILTCILALENAEVSEVVTVSSYAASMPDVQLHIREGEKYYLGDLLYSLMLESHNDVAVAIAEHISGSQEEFSRLMNQKAKEIGCDNTTFLTPNGLDATSKTKEISHGTTARDLALMMRYCIKVSPKRDYFIKITQTPTYSFQNLEGTRTFLCRNHNAFLNMMEGVISGKTGFTGKAGYCYVGALERDGKCYIVALLACGWPGNKTYKWKDCRRLMEYGLREYESFELKALEDTYKQEMSAEIKDAKGAYIGDSITIDLRREEHAIQQILLKKGENVEVKVRKKELAAPIYPGEDVGVVEYYIQGEKWLEEEVYCDRQIEKIDFKWCLLKIFQKMVKI